MLKKLSIRFFRLCLFLLLLLLPCRYGLNFALGVILKHIFTNGTRCEVTFKNPRLSFFPIRASIDDAMIRHAFEPKEAGFRAKHISIRFYFAKLFSREIMLSDLELRNASASSEGSETGFINTLAFLFPSDEEKAKLNQNSRVAKFLHDWPVHVTTIRIFTDPEKKDQLQLGFREHIFQWDQVQLEFIEQDSDPQKPYDLRAVTKNLRFREDGKPILAAGDLETYSELGMGKLQIREAKLSSRLGTDLTSDTELTGKLKIKVPGEYDIHFKSNAKKAYLAGVLPTELIAIDNLPETAHVEASLSGDFQHPLLDGEVALLFGPEAFVGLRRGCGIQNMTASFRLTPDEVSLRNVAVEDLVQGANLQFGLQDNRNIHGLLRAELRKEKRWMKDCFSLTESEQSKSPMVKGIGETLTDSVSELSFDGTLSPLKVHSVFRADVSASRKDAHSKLEAHFEFDEEKYHFLIKERGLVPQIQQSNGSTLIGKLGRVPQENVSSQTNFSLAVNSNIDAEGDYFPHQAELELERFQIVRYPMLHLLSRASLFLSTELFEKLTQVVRPESLLNFDFRGRLFLRDRKANAKGSIRASGLQLAGIPIDSVALPIELEGDKFAFRNARGEVSGGIISGTLQFSEREGIEGNFTARGVSLDQSPELERFLPGAKLQLSGEGSVQGKLENPKYLFALNLDSRNNFQADVKHSELKISGDRQRLQLEGGLFGKALNFTLEYPLGAESRENLRIDASARDFSFDEILHSSADSLEMEEKSALSGTLHFSGPRENPLAGEGAISIDDFRFAAGNLVIRQGGNLQAVINKGRLQFTNVKFLVEDKELALTGYVDRESGWMGNLSGNWNLNALVTNLPSLEQATGEIAMQLDIRGPIFAPVLSGPLDLRRASISMPLASTIVGLSEGEAETFFQNGNLEIKSIRGRIGGSFVEASGRIKDVADPSKRDVFLELNLPGVVLEVIENLTTEIMGNLTFRKSPGTAFLIGGELQIKRALYEDTVSLIELIKAISGTILGFSKRDDSGKAEKGNLKDLEFDLHAFAKNDVILETNVAQAELRGDVRITGNGDRPQVAGKIEVVEGEFGLQSNRFEIVSGQMSFSPYRDSLDPQISLVGETSLLSRTGEQNQVRLLLSGSLLEPKVNFISDSGMRQEEVQALLGLGANVESLQSSKGKKARSFSQLINPVSGISIEDRLTALTGFSSVQIDTAFSSTSGEIVPRLSAKRPLTRKLELDLQTELSGNQASEASIDYPLTPYLSLIAGWRNTSAVGNAKKSSGSFDVGVLYRRAFPGHELLPPEVLGKWRGREAEESESPQVEQNP